jgi:hypothetical protein
VPLRRVPIQLAKLPATCTLHRGEVRRRKSRSEVMWCRPTPRHIVKARPYLARLSRRTMTFSVGHFATRIAGVALLCAMAGAAPVAAQTEGPSKRYEIILAGGPSEASRGVDARGWHAGAGLARRLSNRLGAQLDLTGHTYGPVPVPPCLIADSQRCYQELARRVVAGTASVTYQVLPVRQTGVFHGLYVVGGIGLYNSRRTATAYPDCDVSGVCQDREIHEMRLNDTQLGFNGGVGVRSLTPGSPVFAEVRLHFARRSTPTNTPSNDYWLIPFSIGFRF